MKTKKVDINDFTALIIKPENTQKSKNLAFIESFIASGEPVAEVIDNEKRYKNPNTLCTSMREALIRGGYKNKIGAITRKDRVYLLNRELLPEELKHLVNIEKRKKTEWVKAVVDDGESETEN